MLGLVLYCVGAIGFVCTGLFELGAADGLYWVWLGLSVLMMIMGFTLLIRRWNKENEELSKSGQDTPTGSGLPLDRYTRWKSKTPGLFDFGYSRACHRCGGPIAASHCPRCELADQADRDRHDRFGGY